MPRKWFLILIAGCWLGSWSGVKAGSATEGSATGDSTTTWRAVIPEPTSGETTAEQDRSPAAPQVPAAVESPVAEPSVAEPALTPDQQALRDRIRSCLAYYFYRPESTQRRSPWGVMHAIIGFGVDTSLLADDREVNAIAWLCANGPCYRMQLLAIPAAGSVGVRRGPGYQGHDGQLLAILAQSRVKIDYPLVVQGQRLSIADLVHAEQLSCRAGTELTFKLIGLAHYLDPDAAWRNDLGEAWNIAHLVKEELAQPIVGAACGGTHRLMGFSYAVRNRERSGQPLDGQWERAQDYLQQYYAYTFKLQNADGSFSTNWFARRGDQADLDRRLDTTGHTLEWLAYSLPKSQLGDARVVRAVEYLTDLMWRYRGREWEIGPRGHAIHALSLYDERAFGGRLGQRAEDLAAFRRVGRTAEVVERPLVSETPSR
jgi:hypothetical protein